MFTARMHTRRPIPAAALLMALAAGISFTTAAQASPTITPVEYKTLTQGEVGEGWTGPVQFIGTGTADFLAPGSLDLGQFFLNKIPGRTTLDIDDLPFKIELWVWQPGASLTGTDGPVIHIEGRIDGRMKGTTESTLVAQITSITSPQGSPPLPFDLANFSVQLPQVIKPYAGGPTHVYGYISVPEPSALATLLVGVLGLGAHQLRRRRAARA
jgi:hypothetical protein